MDARRQDVVPADGASVTEAGRTGDRGERARRAVAANPHWYHSIELAPGVLTPGRVDLRRVAARLLPASLSGRRCLDVGTFDGFWAFEMERRGAAEVVAIDVAHVSDAEWPPGNRAALEARAREWDVELGRGFRLASEVLEAGVRRVECDVYDLEPDVVGGPVDLVVSGAILLHLRDPVRALERVHGALRPGGELLALEPIAVRETLLSPRRAAARFEPLVHEFNWWVPNLAGLLAWPRAAGFTDVRRAGFHRPPAAPEMRAWYAGVRARRAS